MGHSDYTMGTGSGGVMLVRVADAAGTAGVIGGNEVQFHIRAGSSATWVGSPGFHWNYYINGAWGNDSGQYIGNISGTAWRHVATFYVGSSQNVCFHINDSGTQGFGGPTDFWVAVSRPTVPQAPTPVGIDQITPVSMRYRFSGNGNGGSPITGWQWEAARSADFTVGSTGVMPGSGTELHTGLLPATTYWFRSRGVNAVGAGPWSAVISAQTLAGGRRKVDGVWRDVARWRKVDGVWRRVVRWRKVDGVWHRTR